MVKNSSTPDAQVYVIATPIGNLNDISKRAVETLKNVDLIAAEDTRHSRILLQHLGINTPLTSLHTQNEDHKTPLLLKRLREGQSIALISDAGTPLISDPGFPFIRAAREEGIRVTPIPGCCAFIAALSASSIPCQQFFFAGFFPAKSAARCEQLLHYKTLGHTLVAYESPHRLLECLADIEKVYGRDFELQLAKELTKTHEAFVFGTSGSIQKWLEEDTQRTRGEFVLILPPYIQDNPDIGQHNERILKELLKELPLKQAVRIAVSITGVPKNQLYPLALEIHKSL